MENEKIYELHPYQQTVDTVVQTCEAYKTGYALTLAATVFYPEGGGQPCDTGTLNGVPVTAVFKKGETVYHVTEIPMEPGTPVHGQINWARRFDFMQQHSGEHIATGTALKLFGANNAGFHLSEHTVLLDLDKELTKEQLAKVEETANKAIYENAHVHQFFPSEEEMEKLTFREKPGRIHGDLRVVDIAGYDTCACCGTHVAAAGEIGIIKFLSFQKYKGGTRITMASGARALQDYNEKQAGVQAVSALLSAKPGEIAPAVEALLAENDKLRQQVNSYRTAEIETLAATVQTNEKGAFCYKAGYAAADLRRLALALAPRLAPGGIAVALGGKEGALQYALAAGEGADVQETSSTFNAATNGRGGGSKELVQGSTPAPLAQVLAAVAEMGIAIEKGENA